MLIVVCVMSHLSGANGYLMCSGNTMYGTMAVKVAKLWPPKVGETKAKLGIWLACMDTASFQI